MFSFSVNIQYTITGAAIPLIGSIPEGNSINVVNGVDQSGTFPPTVVFRNAATTLPYTGSLVSEGDVELIQQSVSVPTLGEWGLVVLIAGVLGIGLLTSR
jgi:hypothetical protein